MHGAADMPTAEAVSTTEASAATAESCVPTAKARMAAATAVASSAMLRPQGHSQEKRERRDGHQATHTNAIISPFFKNWSSFTIGDEDAEAGD